ncbi:MAG: phosphotransferase [Rhodobacteraceae bacterium]|jgi:Ser/Thr protein kinase RdoA (MazF antagonist)|nr:phosphotransferase [Paracoccaceae bacterium]
MTPSEAEALAAEALAIWGGTEAPVLMKLRENAVFAATLPEVGRAVLRIHRRGYQSEDAIRSELWWLEALADRGLAVPRPLVTPEGAHVAHLADGRFASMLAWVEGTAIGAAGVPLGGDAAAQIRIHASVGHAVAELHVATDRLHLPPAFQRPRWDAEGLLGETPFWGRFWDHPGATASDRATLSAFRHAAAARLADYAAGGADQGLIHADVLRENVLWQGHRAALIDFDDAGWGFRLYDLGTALSQCLSEPHLPALAEALAAGYATERPLSEADHAMLPWFTALRCAASVGWTMPRLAPDDPIQQSHLARAVRAAGIVLDGGDLLAAPARPA